MLEIKNDNLTVEINPRGAELTHIVDNASGFDYIWNGPEWPKHAPILFPSIGRSTEDSYLLKGKVFPMQQHGFASDFDFKVINQKDAEISLVFTDNEVTRKSYPFSFEMIVNYKLKATSLAVSFSVRNMSEEALSFALGFHPAFNLPGEFSDYHIQLLPENIDLKQFEIVKNPFPYRSGNLVDFEHEAKDFALNREIFEKGLVILDNNISKVKLVSSKTNFAVQLDIPEFPYLCLWTKEDMDLPYLCIEPFQGLPDIINQKQELLEKEANIKLAAKEIAFYYTKMTFQN